MISSDEGCDRCRESMIDALLGVGEVEGERIMLAFVFELSKSFDSNIAISRVESA